MFHLTKFPFVYALVNKFKMVAQISPLNSLELVTTCVILLHEKFLQFDWLRAVVFQLNLKYLHVKITKPLWVVV